MAFFMDPGAMFLGCLNGVEQKFLIELIKTARRSGYTRFVEPCAGTFAMANLAIQSGFKPEQIETSDVNMMTSVMGYAITGQSLEPLQIHAQGFSDEELLDPAVALYAQIYLRTSKSAGNEYFHNILRDLHDRREEHIESIRRQLEATKSLLGGMSYRPMDMWDHLREVKDDLHTIIVANPPTYFAGYQTELQGFFQESRNPIWQPYRQAAEGDSDIRKWGDFDFGRFSELELRMYSLIKAGIATKSELDEAYTLDEALKLYALYSMDRDIERFQAEEMQAEMGR